MFIKLHYILLSYLKMNPLIILNYLIEQIVLISYFLYLKVNLQENFSGLLEEVQQI